MANHLARDKGLENSMFQGWQAPTPGQCTKACRRSAGLLVGNTLPTEQVTSTAEIPLEMGQRQFLSPRVGPGVTAANNALLGQEEFSTTEVPQDSAALLGFVKTVQTWLKIPGSL